MTWYAFHGYPTLNADAELSTQLGLAGFHGYATESAANAHPNSVNIFSKWIVDEAEAQSSAVHQVLGAADTTGHAVTSSVDIAGKIIDFIKQPGIYVRGAEILAGLLVLYIGLKATVSPEGAKLATRTTGDTFKSIAKAAKYVK